MWSPRQEPDSTPDTCCPRTGTAPSPRETGCAQTPHQAHVARPPGIGHQEREEGGGRHVHTWILTGRSRGREQGRPGANISSKAAVCSRHPGLLEPRTHSPGSWGKARSASWEPLVTIELCAMRLLSEGTLLTLLLAHQGTSCWHRCTAPGKPTPLAVSSVGPSQPLVCGAPDGTPAPWRGEGTFSAMESQPKSRKCRTWGTRQTTDRTLTSRASQTKKAGRCLLLSLPGMSGPAPSSMLWPCPRTTVDTMGLQTGFSKQVNSRFQDL